MLMAKVYISILGLKKKRRLVLFLNVNKKVLKCSKKKVLPFRSTFFLGKDI